MALTRQVKQLVKGGRLELVHFPYDPVSHTRKTGVATPSDAQVRDLNLPVKDLPGVIADYSGSQHFNGILSIIGNENRRDALHVDSAVKSGCSAFLTKDAHILKHRTLLESLLGMRFFDPDDDLSELEGLIKDHSQASRY